LSLVLGMLGSNIFDLGDDLDIIIGSDCLYDTSMFEDVITTIAWLLEHNPKATFIFSYQARSSDCSMENLLKKWNLNCRNIDLESIGKDTDVDMKELSEGHSIFLLEMYRKS